VAEIKQKKQVKIVAKAKTKKKYDKIYNSCILDKSEDVDMNVATVVVAVNRELRESCSWSVLVTEAEIWTISGIAQTSLHWEIYGTYLLKINIIHLFIIIL